MLKDGVEARNCQAWLGSGGAMVLVWLASLGCRPSVDRLPDATAPRKFQVASSSMAPGLLGPSLQMQCTSCGQALLIAAETAMPQWPTRCFACGGLCAATAKRSPGETVTLYPLEDTSTIQRFDRIVFRDPGRGEPRVKRVWGLSGEQIQLRAGELWVDGKLFQKSMAELQRIAVPVASYPVHGSDEPPRFPAIIQCASPTGLRLQPRQNFHWQYRLPARVAVEDAPRDQWLHASQIMDDYALNQGISRRLEVVEDCWLRLQLESPLIDQPQAAGIEVQIVVGGHQVRVLAHGSLHPPSELGAATLAIRCHRQLDLAVCDQRLLIVSDVASRVAPLIDVATDSMEGSPFQLTLTCKQPTEIAVVALEVWRDLYLSDGMPGATRVSETIKLPPHGFFVLGDNLPVSIDSRGALGIVDQRQIIGRLR